MILALVFPVSVRKPKATEGMGWDEVGGPECKLSGREYWDCGYGGKQTPVLFQ